MDGVWRVEVIIMVGCGIWRMRVRMRSAKRGSGLGGALYGVGFGGGTCSERSRSWLVVAESLNGFARSGEGGLDVKVRDGGERRGGREIFWRQAQRIAGSAIV